MTTTKQETLLRAEINAFGVVLKVYPSIVKEQAGSVNKHEIKKNWTKYAVFTIHISNNPKDTIDYYKLAD